LRTTDVVAHAGDGADFLVALSARTRDGATVAVTTDCRAMLARLGAAMERACGLRIESGWTTIRDGTTEEARANAIEAALERGARERERYAFFSTIGHELRTPLTSIRGYLETLLDGDLDATTVRRFTQTALAETLRMKRLVDGMFDVSVLDLRAGSALPESCRARAAIESAVAATMPAARERGCALVLHDGEDARLAIAHDRLVQIVVNLLENAIKHGHAHGRVEAALLPLDGRFVEVRVDDDGPGVPPEEREAVFALARRGAGAEAPGTGIGLAVVRLLAERVGGEVDVDVAPLGGARFRARLPLAVEESRAPDVRHS